MATQNQQEASSRQPQPLKYKTWNLKVFIHCQGCMKKVRRILHNIEGVFTIEIDPKLHKVTITGNTDSATLITKLHKSGKHAEPWPETPIKPTKSKPKSKEPNPNPNPKGKPEPEPTTPMTTHQEPGPVSNSENQTGGKTENSLEIETTPAAPEKKGSEGGAEERSGISGSTGKKKKKKGQNGNNEKIKINGSKPGKGNGPAGTEPGDPVQVPISVNGDRTVYDPVQVQSKYAAVSYNTAWGNSTASVGPTGFDVEMGKPLDWGAGLRGPSDPFGLFSEENPNACSVM